jgi:hypothetical protein
MYLKPPSTKYNPIALNEYDGLQNIKIKRGIKLNLVIPFAYFSYLK